jgi:hypothetical protein
MAVDDKSKVGDVYGSLDQIKSVSNTVFLSEKGWNNGRSEQMSNAAPYRLVAAIGAPRDPRTGGLLLDRRPCQSTCHSRCRSTSA